MPTDSSIDRTAEELDTLAKAVGLLVIQWGQAEQSLDLLVALLWHEFNGRAYARKLPQMLEPKLRFVRDTIHASPQLSAYTMTTDELISRFKVLSKMRHDVIHGAVASISPVDNAFLFAKLDIRDGYHNLREVRIQAEQYPELIDQLVDLGRMAHELAAAVFAYVKSLRPPIR